jgi:hypothetical protein
LATTETRRNAIGLCVSSYARLIRGVEPRRAAPIGELVASILVPLKFTRTTAKAVLAELEDLASWFGLEAVEA